MKLEASDSVVLNSDPMMKERRESGFMGYLSLQVAPDDELVVKREL